MNEIISRDNQWVKLACSLKHKKERTLGRQLFVEGFRLIEEAARSGLSEVLCFVSPAGRQKDTFSRLYEEGLQLGWQFYAVTDSVYDKLKDTQNPQGIAAILPFFEHTLSGLTAEKLGAKPVLFMQAVQDPGNLGTIIRTAAAANAGAVLLSPGSVDLYNSKTLRSAMGAVFKIPVVPNVDDEALLRFCADHQRQLIGTTPHGTSSYAAVDYGQPVVLAFGNEGAGLTEALMSRCSSLITIPMRRDTESLNLSMSVGLVLYKAWECQGFKGEEEWSM